MLSMLNTIAVGKLLSLSPHLERSNENATKDDIKSIHFGRGLPVFIFFWKVVLFYKKNIH